MSNKMLIDATHPEETRVVVLRGNRVEEFDFEAADRRQLRGNIYLAKVTRVEPSLQAAFVDYGGNRHGFLAFSEIHPDYYQIPFADRQALLQEQAREDAEQAERDDESVRNRPEADTSEAADEEGAADVVETIEPHGPEGGERNNEGENGDAEATVAEFAASESDQQQPTPSSDEPGEMSEPPAMAADATPTESVSSEPLEGDAREAEVERAAEEDADTAGKERERDEEKVENVGAEDALEELPDRSRKPRPRQYKIQEVIKRRQVLLVQVVKEERGNKGAALTTYLSLAGRYSVLMPNTARGGGISRKITTPLDRKRLKSIASELEVPEGMGVILRTAGANRTKAEIKRDFEYLLRLWENVRELTLRSTAPQLVYEEGSLIKRSIRDLYSREIDQVVVAGDDAYREAKDFMRMLMPSHARNVQLYKDVVPVFARNGVEAQLDAMFSPQVTLKSGGYIVINQTEALVSIDVNSGRSTREHSIEDTALKTNLEAAEEISRQLRLRDLAGLIVIDFIDMEEKRNNRSVERKLKDCLRFDRARIQVGRISHFGLLEMSRQRIRTGVLESSTVSCPHCHGTGQVRSVSSLSLQILRSIEDQLLRNSSHHLLVRTRPEVALYVLNQKRRHLAELEARFAVTIAVSGEAPENGAGFTVERGAPVGDRPEPIAVSAPIELPVEVAPAEDDVRDDEEREADQPEEGRDRQRRRRRRRRGNGDDRHDHHPHEHHTREHQHAEPRAEFEAEGDEGETETVEAGGAPSGGAANADDESRDSRRRRRGRRGGRRRGRGREGAERGGEGYRAGGPPSGEFQQGEGSEAFDEAAPGGNGHAEELEAQSDAVEERGAYEVAPPEPAPPEPTRFEPPPPEPPPSPAPQPVVAAEPPPEPEDPNRPKRSGWWNKRSSFF